MVKKITEYKIIALYLNDYNKKYYLREMAEMLKKPHQTIKPYVEELSKKGVLTKIKRKNIIEYGLNIKKAYNHLIIAEKERLIERLQDTIFNILFEKLFPFFGKNTFMVFGSAVDNLKKGSDIDLLIIGKNNIRDVEDFQETYNKKIHKIQVDNIEKLTPALIREIYKKHTIFNNTEQIVKFFGEQYEKNKLV